MKNNTKNSIKNTGKAFAGGLLIGLDLFGWASEICYTVDKKPKEKYTLGMIGFDMLSNPAYNNKKYVIPALGGMITGIAASVPTVAVSYLVCALADSVYNSGRLIKNHIEECNKPYLPWSSNDIKK